MKISIETTQNVLIQYEAASIGDRILAYFIDLAIALAYWILCVAFVGWTVEEGSATQGVILALLFLPVLGYHLIFELALDGQSPGKRAMNLRVVAASGRQPEFVGYLLRWILRPIDILAMWGMVAVMAIVVGGKGQRLGDILAETTVVRLQRQVRFSQDLFPKFQEDYQMVFPQVRAMNDRDANIIKEVLRKYRRTRDSHLLQQLSRKVKDTLQVETELPHLKFLEQVIKDYHHWSSSVA
jgi:uncharacterized RDD family membrane protein YckC